MKKKFEYGNLEYKGYKTHVVFSEEDKMLCGKIDNVKDLIFFESKSANDIESKFHEAVDDYIEQCDKINKKYK